MISVFLLLIYWEQGEKIHLYRNYLMFIYIYNLYYKNRGMTMTLFTPIGNDDGIREKPIINENNFINPILRFYGRTSSGMTTTISTMLNALCNFPLFNLTQQKTKLLK